MDEIASGVNENEYDQQSIILFLLLPLLSVIVAIPPSASAQVH